MLTPDGQKHVLIEGGVSACYSPSGHVVYARGGEIMAVAFDEQGLAIVGQPVAIEHGGMQVSTEGGTHPIWLQRGTALAYGVSNPGRIMVAPVTINGASFDSGEPRELVALPPSTVSFDVARDGSRVLALTASGDQDSVRELNVVLNWFSVVASRAPR